MENHFGQLDTPMPKPSLGLVNKIIKHLRDEAFIEVLPDGGFRLRDPVKLLLAWRDAYRFDRHERRNYFTLLQGKRACDGTRADGSNVQVVWYSDDSRGSVTYTVPVAGSRSLPAGATAYKTACSITQTFPTCSAICGGQITLSNGWPQFLTQ